MQASHETIYKILFIQARGALKKELLQHLRKSRAMRRSRHKTLKGEGLGQITKTVSIRERPAEAEDRAVPGHREGDLLFGGKNSQIATLVECLLLRSTTPVATWLERKRQWTNPTVLPERHGPVERASKLIKCRGKTTQRSTQEDFELLFSSREVC